MRNKNWNVYDDGNYYVYGHGVLPCMGWFWGFLYWEALMSVLITISNSVHDFIIIFISSKYIYNVFLRYEESCEYVWKSMKEICEYRQISLLCHFCSVLTGGIVTRFGCISFFKKTFFQNFWIFCLLKFNSSSRVFDDPGGVMLWVINSNLN